jgi:rod shape-determining protein MreC
VARASRIDSRFDTGLFVLCVFLAFVAHGLPAHLREPIAGTMRRTLVAPLVALQRNAELSRAAWLGYETSARARDSMALQAMRVNSLESENERFRRLLGLGRELRWGYVPAEGLQTGAAGGDDELMLSSGSNAGVKPFSPVVAPDGLVGMVRTVDPRTSIAIMWTHPDFRVSAMAGDGSAFGIAQAHEGTDTDRYLLELRGVPMRSGVKKGTLIVSSGLGGVYPKGIPIGTVIDTLRSDGYARKYLLRPAVLPADVLSVMILQPQRAASGVEQVWAGSVAQADSIARAAAAIDSARLRPAVPVTAGATGQVTTAAPPAVAAPSANPDSVAAAAAAARLRRARRDSIRADSVRRDSVRRAAAQRDSVNRDTTRRDSTPRPAVVVPDTIPVPPPIIPPR